MVLSDKRKLSDRRAINDRRRFTYSAHSPERRSTTGDRRVSQRRTKL